MGYGGGEGGRLYTCRYTVTARMTCSKIGSDESHFNVSLIVRDKVTRQCPQTTTFEEKGELKWNRTEVLLLTSLTVRPNRLTSARIKLKPTLSSDASCRPWVSSRCFKKATSSPLLSYLCSSCFGHWKFTLSQTSTGCNFWKLSAKSWCGSAYLQTGTEVLAFFCKLEEWNVQF